MSWYEQPTPEILLTVQKAHQVLFSWMNKEFHARHMMQVDIHLRHVNGCQY